MDLSDGTEIIGRYSVTGRSISLKIHSRIRTMDR